jgi:hypothetical protein
MTYRSPVAATSPSPSSLQRPPRQRGRRPIWTPELQVGLLGAYLDELLHWTLKRKPTAKDIFVRMHRRERFSRWSVTVLRVELSGARRWYASLAADAWFATNPVLDPHAIAAVEAEPEIPRWVWQALLGRRHNHSRTTRPASVPA